VRPRCVPKSGHPRNKETDQRSKPLVRFVLQYRDGGIRTRDPLNPIERGRHSRPCPPNNLRRPPQRNPSVTPPFYALVAQVAARQAAAYTGQVLSDAERVRNARVYSYQRGAATLRDVLAAQRALNEVYLASLEAQAAYSRGLVGLAEAVGDWSLIGWPWQARRTCRGLGGGIRCRRRR